MRTYLSRRARTVASMLALSLAVAACGGGPLGSEDPDLGEDPGGEHGSTDGGTPRSDGGTSRSDGGTPRSDGGTSGSDGGAMCRSSSECASVACHCGDGTVVNYRGCSRGVCATTSSCGTPCAGHDTPATPADAGPTSSCEDRFYTGSTAVRGNDTYVACNKNPSRHEGMPTNCKTGRFVVFESTSQCFCALDCADFATPLHPGDACSNDGSVVCRAIVNRQNQVNNLCVPPGWSSLCRAR